MLRQHADLAKVEAGEQPSDSHVLRLRVRNHLPKAHDPCDREQFPQSRAGGAALSVGRGHVHQGLRALRTSERDAVDRRGREPDDGGPVHDHHQRGVSGVPAGRVEVGPACARERAALVHGLGAEPVQGIEVAIVGSARGEGRHGDPICNANARARLSGDAKSEHASRGRAHAPNER